MPRGGPSILMWTDRQRKALVAILVALLIYLSIRYALNPSFVSDPQPEVPPRAVDLADRIDPNTADEQSLAALPTLGEKRAKLIVDYRLRYARLRPGEVVYQKAEDLLRIRGIGVATVNQVRPFLTFPSDTTQQASSRPG